LLRRLWCLRWAPKMLSAGGVIKGDGGTIRLLTNPSGSQSFPSFVLKRHGLDRKHGFELQTMPVHPTQAAVGQHRVAPAKSTSSRSRLKGEKFGVIHRTGLDWIVTRSAMAGSASMW
jgi:hypothetical protein